MRRTTMNRPPDKNLLETDPHQLASLIGDDDDIGERIWNPDELAAMTKRSRRITKLSDADLRKAIRWALAQPWIEDITRTVFLDGQRFLAGTATGNQTGSPASKPEK